MKRILTIYLLFLCVMAWGQEKFVHKMVSPIESEDMLFEDDSVSIKFVWYSSSGSMHFTVKNKTANRVYIEWENARMAGGRIVFGEDSRLSMRNPKSDEAISTESSSTYHGALYNERWIMSNYVYNPLQGEKIKENEHYTIDFIVPIRFSDGSTTDYKFTIILYHYNIVDYESIPIGMKSKQVYNTLGRPDNRTKKEGKVEEWRYNGCVKILFTGGKVSSIEPYTY